MKDHRPPGGVTTLPVLEDSSIGQHKTQVVTGSCHARKLQRVTVNQPRAPVR